VSQRLPDWTNRPSKIVVVMDGKQRCRACLGGTLGLVAWLKTLPVTCLVCLVNLEFFTCINLLRLVICMRGLQNRSPGLQKSIAWVGCSPELPGCSIPSLNQTSYFLRLKKHIILAFKSCLKKYYVIVELEITFSIEPTN
jgi:hypothetical protein